MANQQLIGALLQVRMGGGCLRRTGCDMDHGVAEQRW
jgi:hypothetical protein